MTEEKIDNPSTYVEKGKAWEMAHAEKPYRDDAHVIGKMIANAETDPIVAEYDAGRTMGWGPSEGDEAYEDKLWLVRRDTEELAKRAGEIAGEAYDDFQEAQNTFNSRIDDLRKP